MIRTVTNERASSDSSGMISARSTSPMRKASVYVPTLSCNPGKLFEAGIIRTQSRRPLEDAAQHAPSVPKQALRAREINKAVRKRIRTARRAVRLIACVEAAGVQTMARDARINVDNVGHYSLNIMIGSLSNIVTKWRSGCWAQLSTRSHSEATRDHPPPSVSATRV